MDVKAIFDALGDPQMRHAAIVHLPVALATVGVLLALVAALLAGRFTTLRWVTCGVYLLLLGAALLGVRSGEDAEEELGGLPDEVYAIVERHEEMAQKVWIFALVTTLLATATVVPWTAVRRGAGVLMVFAALATAGWVGVTAHHGGTLVYAHGVGGPEAVAGAVSSEDEDVDPRVAFFRERVRPVLEASCTRCHNAAKFRGRLDQTSIAGLLAGGRSGPAIVPGRPDQSLLITAVRWEDEDLQMPPPPDDEKLPAEQIDDLVRWIREGAVWE